MSRTFSTLALVIASCCLAFVQADFATAPIGVCESVKGFAGEVNYQFSVTIATPPREGEAIVLVARAVPYLEGSSLPLPQMSAIYLLRGVETPVAADRFGVLQIADQVDPDTIVNVTVSNIRPDGPTPFLFYSYHTGYRSCSLLLSPSVSFSGPLPVHVSNTNNPSLVYLKATPPPNARTFSMQLHGNAVIAFSPKEHELGSLYNLEAAQTAVPSPGQPIYITLRLREGVTVPEFVRVSLVWGTSGGEAPPASPTGPSPPSPVTPSSPDAPWTAPIATPSAPSNQNSDRAKVAEGTSIPVVLFVLVLTYFVVRSVYNYRVQHITEFPKFVPHHEAFSAVATFCGSLGSHVRNRGRGSFLNRGAYSEVDREEMPAY